MPIMIVGGTGFLGAAVTRRLCKSGHSVTVFHRGRTHAELPSGVSFIHGSRDELAVVAGEVEAAAPEIVVDVVPYTEAHATDMLAVLERVSTPPRRVVVVSSSDVYRNYDGWRGASDHAPDPVPLAVSSPLRETLHPYRGMDLDFAYADEYDKILVEQAYRDHSISATILRLPAVYGPGQDTHRFAPFLKQMQHGTERIRLGQSHAQWQWTHGYVENVAAAIAHAALHKRAAETTYNLGERDTPTVRERLKMLADAVGWSGAIEVVPDEDLDEEDRVPGYWQYRLATRTRDFREETGFADPVAQPKALRATCRNDAV